MKLTHKLSVGIFAIIITLMIAILSILHLTTSHAVEQKIIKDLQTAQTVFEHFQDRRFQNLLTFNRTVAEMPHLKALVTTPDLERRIVTRLVEDVRRAVKSDVLMLLDSQGNLIISLDEPHLQGVNMLDRVGIKEALEGRDFWTVREENGELQQIVASPLKFGSEIAGVLLTGFNLDSKVIDEIQRMTNAQVAVFSGEQVSLATRVTEAMQNAMFDKARSSMLINQMETVSVENENFIFLHSKLPKLNMSYILARSLDQELQFYVTVRTQLICVAGFVLLLAWILSRWYSLRISRPVQELVSGAERIAKGDFDFDLEEGSNDEFGNLSRTFNTMKRDLKGSRDDLIEDIAKREKLENQLIELYESGKNIFSSMHLEEVLDTVVRVIFGALKCDQVSIMLMDGEETLRIAASRGLPESVKEHTKVKVGERVAGRVAELKQEFLLNGDLGKYPEFEHLEKHEQVKSSIVCPLMNENEVLGVLNLTRLEGMEEFTEHDLHYANIFASQVAQAVRNSKLYSDLKNKMSELGNAYEKLRDTQHQLIESEKLASIGRIVSGVAHEMNNPLAVVMGYSEMILASDFNDEKVRERIAKIQLQAERCKHIVEDLLAFARHRKQNLEVIDLKTLISDAVESPELQLKENNIALTMEFPEDKVSALVDKYQIFQVVTNLITNAKHAMEYQDTAKEIHISIQSKSAHKWVLEIRDSGPGIPEDTVKKIFEPFFTTKRAGKGTGLGLSLCYGIVQSHGGTIEVKSKVDKGTSFLITLPVASESDERAVKKDEGIKFNVDREGKKILIIEDQSEVADIGGHVLEDAGYEVNVCRDGESALNALSKHLYDAVVCDFFLPGITGGEVFEKITEQRNDYKVKFIMVSGLIGCGGEVDKLIENHNLPAVSKPFSSKELLQAVDLLVSGSTL